MSKAGCPYDNAPMERFYNTFKSNFYNVTSFSNVEVMDELTTKYINWYNYVRPHSHNNYLTPMEARYKQVFIEQSVTKKLDQYNGISHMRKNKQHLHESRWGPVTPSMMLQDRTCDQSRTYQQPPSSYGKTVRWIVRRGYACAIRIVQCGPIFNGWKLNVRYSRETLHARPFNDRVVDKIKKRIRR